MIPTFRAHLVTFNPICVQPIPQIYPHHLPSPYPIFNEHQQLREEVVAGKTLRMIGWCPPPPGWVKINTDGAYKSSIDLGSAGGLVRDSNGNWCAGFSINLGGSVTPLEAEFIAILGGLELVWKMGCKNIMLESDCKVAVDFLTARIDGEVDDHLVQSIKEMVGREWNVMIRHEYREGNQAADGLANLGIQLSTGYHEFLHPPPAILNHIIKDRNGAKYPRLCAVNRI